MRSGPPTRSIRRFLLPVLLFAFSIFTSVLSAQQPGPPGECMRDTSRYVVIRSIILEGNKQTRPQVIRREMSVREGDTLTFASLRPALVKNRDNIFNLHLFNFVTIDTLLVSREHCIIDVRVHVIERWYIWPWPFFEFSSRNFNEWLETMDLSRLSYGVDLTVLNVRGRNETLIIPIHFGFNEKYGFIYSIPYLNRSKTVGISFGADYERNHEVIVASNDNKTVYYKDPGQYPLQKVLGSAEVRLRPGIYSMHYLRAGYSSYYFSDSLVKLGYSSGDRGYVQFFTASYQYRNDRRDEHFYPLKGSYFDISGTYDGLFSPYLTNIYLESTLRKYWQIYHRWYFASGLYAKYTLSENQPYFLQQGLGYGRNYVRGYEYYVIDGQHFFVWKSNLKFALVPKRVLKINFLKSQKFNTVPWAFYLNVYTDLGYVYNRDPNANKTNDLQNSLLVGYGAGIDFTTYYDLVFRLEFSLNGMGIPGVYLHFIAPI
jgi:outer membrane protein assembly factor BamA